MAYPFSNLNCLLAQILVVPEHGTECTRGNWEDFSLVSTPLYPVGMENRSRDFKVVSSLGKHCTSLDQPKWRQEMFSPSLLRSVFRGWSCSPEKPLQYSPYDPSNLLALLKRTCQPQSTAAGAMDSLYIGQALPKREQEEQEGSANLNGPKCERFLLWCKRVEPHQQNKSLLKRFIGLNTAFLCSSEWLSNSRKPMSCHMKQEKTMEACFTPESWAFQSSFLLTTAPEIRQAYIKYFLLFSNQLKKKWREVFKFGG